VAVGEEGGACFASRNRACTWRVARMSVFSSEVRRAPFEVLEGPWCVHTYLEERGFVVSSCCLQSRLPRRSSDQVSACLHYPQTRQKSNDRLR